MTKQIELAQLKALSPIDSLKKDNLHALVKKTKVRDAQPARSCSAKATPRSAPSNVLNGTVELREGDATTAKIVRRRRRGTSSPLTETAASTNGHCDILRRVTSRSTAICST
jgi:hypothetical protein